MLLVLMSDITLVVITWEAVTVLLKTSCEMTLLIIDIVLHWQFIRKETCNVLHKCVHNCNNTYMLYNSLVNLQAVNT